MNVMKEAEQEAVASKAEITKTEEKYNEEAKHPAEDTKEETIATAALQESVEEELSDEVELENPSNINADPSKLYYLALGDSLTKGVGDEEQKSGYTKRLVEKIEQWSDVKEVILDNRGKRGRRSDQLLRLIQKGHYDNEIKNAELITITIGGNDIMKVVKKDLFELKKKYFEDELITFEERYNLILEEIRLKNPEVPIVVIGLYNPFSIITDEITEFESIITEWNKTIHTTSKTYNNTCFVDIQDLFDENANLVYHTDFFHPNGYGYTIMTERILSMIKSCQIEDISKG
ncbi:GDSL-type esterase/lipase family protein [Ureibacillus aquaedulcis]|uniref:GDSL-type esterase/lipase family protein n=1 Tax=Ureibacillus aquaedulcis TaxID=3058421 RepID=A0ABT8GMR0_9BACL|nr:GDSL-type esterase/lipase family protein [Ureibacillus sp. BA0131]MDN4492681.1 GDSL-type esterase/lipase family protein [Ureibacillus sp. BA0131]